MTAVPPTGDLDSIPATSGRRLDRLVDRLVEPLGRRAPLARKLVKYSAASAVGVICGQSALIFCSAVLGWPGVASNLTAVTVGAVPNYLMNRYWTWSKRGPNHLWGEVVPFWVMTLLGLLLSTWAVSYADDRWGSTFAISVANLSGFGVLWVVKFVLLDKLLFATKPGLA